MANEIRLIIAQLNFIVGDIENNTKKIIGAAKRAHNELEGDIIIFSELAISGYPPEDLLLRPDLYQRVDDALKLIQEQCTDIDIILGYPSLKDGKKYNCAGLIRDGKLHSEYTKQNLPNYNVFDEQRYFTAGNNACIIDIKDVKTAITVCEDLWQDGPMQQAKAAGAQLMICINASPFDANKDERRQKMLSEHAIQGDMPIIYANTIGGQDELVFDGGSMAVNANGELHYHLPFFEELLEAVTISTQAPIQILTNKHNPAQSVEQRVYDALVLGVRDYILKNNFKSAIIGLSGGIDSALTLAIAVDAIGAAKVEAVMMPSRYTSQMSLDDADEQARLLNIEHHVISIEQPFEAFLDTLSDEFKHTSSDTTEENIQARCRGIILMAISNKKGAIVLSTGNKSELSVGYATLYGDMVGGFCVLKDIPKTLVYRLANYRNSIDPVIPQRVIDRPPSAELAENQLDQDTLPPYDILDQILEKYVEQDMSPQQIIDHGFDATTVKKVIRMVDTNEYKRHQAPVGVRISRRAFGKDRRYPITSRYHRD